MNNKKIKIISKELHKLSVIKKLIKLNYFSDLISTMTGGQAEIQSIEAYGFQDRGDIGNYDVGSLESQRCDYIKTYSCFTLLC